jgi:hypothetical protein
MQNPELALQHLTVYDGASKKSMEEAIGGKAEIARAVLRWLHDEQLVEIVPVGQTHRHHITDTGRTYLAEHS